MVVWWCCCSVVWFVLVGWVWCSVGGLGWVCWLIGLLWWNVSLDVIWLVLLVCCWCCSWCWVGVFVLVDGLVIVCDWVGVVICSLVIGGWFVFCSCLFVFWWSGLLVEYFV